MKKNCPECNKGFAESDAEFHVVRLSGVCTPCREAGPDPVGVFSSLVRKQEEDIRLRRLSDSLTRGVKANVTSGPQQISLITIIRYGPCTVGEVAEFVGLDQSSITLHLKKFEHEGLVTVTPGADKRRKIVEATDKARHIYRKDNE